jgi:putative transposase
MLANRDLTSSKFYKEIPCVLAKSLITKYQKRPECKRVRRLCLPICGDKGKQVKLDGDGIRVPALFKKSVLPVMFRKPIVGFVRQVEFFKRKDKWFCSICYNTPCEAAVQFNGFVGVDRNSRGNVAVLADPQAGVVRFFGFDASRTKYCWRRRKRRLQKQKRFRLLSRLWRKQSRRTTLENHRVSKGIVDYAALHCRSIALENLGDVRKDGSKIKRYTEKSQWSYAQLETFIRYKAALRGVAVLSINPAYTSQTCTRCGNRHRPIGKLFHCGTCGHSNHRDVEAAWNIAHFASLRHTPVQDAAGVGSIDGPVSGKEDV